ncbi:MAG: hypothetical protein ABIE07_02285 [Candidatus Zixiibacteriota bacterium]
MNRDHLTDEQIQGFLDRSIILDDETAFHLNTCPQCQQVLSDYKAVIAGLSEEPEMALSASFADSVIEKIPELNQFESEEKSKFFIFGEKAIAAVFAVVVIAAAIYFINFEQIFANLANSFAASETTSSSSLTWFESKLSEFGKFPLLALFTFLTFALIAGIDSFVKHQRKQSSLRIFSV